MNKKPKGNLRQLMRNARLACLLCLTWLGQTALGNVWYVDAVDGNNENDGLSVSNAKSAIQAAIDQSKEGDVIYVNDGVYSPIVATNNISIISISGPEKTIIDGANKARCAKLNGQGNARDSFLSGFTLCNGNLSKEDGGGTYCGVVSNCIYRSNKARSGGGAYGSQISHSLLEKNSATTGGACGSGCSLINCTISDNTATGSGGGIYYSWATNCLIVANTASDNGGGACLSELVNCTLSQNRARQGGGVYDEFRSYDTVRRTINSIIYGNTAENASNDVFGASILYSCSTGIGESDGNISASPLFVDSENGDFHLQKESRCINAGLNILSLLSMSDLDGNLRVRQGCVDMGAYESFLDDQVGVYVKQSKGGVLSCSTLTISKGGAIEYTVSGYHDLLGIYTNGVLATTEHNFIWENLQEDGFIEAQFDLSTQIVFWVDSANGSDMNEGVSKSTPFKTIQKAIDVAVKNNCYGDKICVRDGVYGSIVVDNFEIEIESENGPKTTIIDGEYTNRCATLISDVHYAKNNANNGAISATNTIIRGFTLTNGACETSDGAALFTEEIGEGGGVIGGTLINCIVKNNVSSSMGGGVFGSYLKDCIVQGNVTGYGGGGTCLCILERCLVMDNVSQMYGGGYYCTYAYNSVVYNNSASYGGGESHSESINCTIINNVANADGGGGNWSTQKNCINYGNEASSNYKTSYHSQFTCCCVDQEVEGEGNIVADPLLLDVSALSFSLRKGSPCIDSGDNDLSVGDLDFFKQARKQGSCVDIGAVEFSPVIETPDETIYENVWGSWSLPQSEPFAIPESVSSWNELARVLWNARDAAVRSGMRCEIPPGDDVIVLSLGAISVSKGQFFGDEDFTTDMENGVQVWRLHAIENEASGLLEASIGSKVFDLGNVPQYLGKAWCRDVYGNPPKWLDEKALEEWYAKRSRSRIAWVVTLVPNDKWASYLNAGEVLAKQEDQNETPRIVLKSIVSDNTSEIHGVSVLSANEGQTMVFSSDDLNSTNWHYKGYAVQPRGIIYAGAFSTNSVQFFKAIYTPLPEDSDSDGISDIMETTVYGTDAGKSDSSGDGLSDWDKIYRYGLNPHVCDTDADGYDDDEEIANSKNPTVHEDGSATSIRYVYDDDDRLVGTYVGDAGGFRTRQKLSPAGNPTEIKTNK